MPHLYETDGAAIYRQSFATIRAEADLARFTADEEPVVVRMIHAAGMVGLEAACPLYARHGAPCARGLAGRRADHVRRAHGLGRHHAGTAAGRQCRDLHAQ